MPDTPPQQNVSENLRSANRNGIAGFKPHELHNLDILRSIAVTLVLIDHTSWALGHHVFGTWETADVGVFGVYLFFIHTSLVLMWSMQRQPNILSFYIRRAFRIYPLAMTAVLVALIFRIPVGYGGAAYIQQHFDFLTILSNLFLVQDLAHRANIVGVMWTLTLEMQMYLVLPCLFLLASYGRRIWQLLLLWLLVIAQNHLTVMHYSTTNSLPTVAPIFLSGVIAYVAFQKFRAVLPAWTFIVFIFGLLALYMRAPGPPRGWPIALAMGVMLPLFKQFSNRSLVSIGHQVAKYSYGIYLWHTFGMKLSFHFLPWGNGTVKVVGELVITAIASILGYHLIEAPMIRLGNRLAKAQENRTAVAVTKDLVSA
jgi:peptidoglycan/LPS O-acetylase OafA/YrhL